MNNIREPESPTILMLYKATQDVYVHVFGSRVEGISKRDIEKIRTCKETLKLILRELDLRYPEQG